MTRAQSNPIRSMPAAGFMASVLGISQGIHLAMVYNLFCPTRCFAAGDQLTPPAIQENPYPPPTYDAAEF